MQQKGLLSFCHQAAPLMGHLIFLFKLVAKAGTGLSIDLDLTCDNKSIGLPSTANAGLRNQLVRSHGYLQDL
jgi:hypothetical protein